MRAQEPPAHVRALKRDGAQLIESMRRVDRLVAALFERGHLSDQERQRVNSQPTMFDRVRELMNVLVRKPPEAYQCFLEALSSTNQDHLRDLLTGAGRIKPFVGIRPAFSMADLPDPGFVYRYLTALNPRYAVGF